MGLVARKRVVVRGATEAFLIPFDPPIIVTKGMRPRLLSTVQNEMILLTGANGMVGTDLAERLMADGHDVIGVDRVPNRWSEDVDAVTRQLDLTDSDALEELEGEFDMIVHLAANARVHRLVENPSGAEENFEATFNVLEFARRNNVDRFLFSSSREVYGNNGKLVYAEDDTYTDECESPYTASKVGGEAMVKAYENCYGINSCILRYSNVYGRYDSSDRVIPLFIAQAHRGDDLTVYGDDKVLDFTFIDDCVDGTIRCIDRFGKAKGTTFNIASGTGWSLLELAETVKRGLDANIDINVEPNRTGEVSRYVADISKAEKLLGYTPTYTFEAGIDRTIEWYTARPELLSEIQAG
jgi:UDP-glucose 4-epimerase